MYMERMDGLVETQQEMGLSPPALVQRHLDSYPFQLEATPQQVQIIQLRLEIAPRQVEMGQLQWEQQATVVLRPRQPKKEHLRLVLEHQRPGLARSQRARCQHLLAIIPSALDITARLLEKIQSQGVLQHRQPTNIQWRLVCQQRHMVESPWQLEMALGQ